jgi:hypothetical protein
LFIYPALTALQLLVPATLHRSPFLDTPLSFKIRFDSPQSGLAAGQYAVAYDGEVCLGGGVIDELGLSVYEESGGFKWNVYGERVPVDVAGATQVSF